MIPYLGLVKIQENPWDWYIYLHEWLIFCMVKVVLKYTIPGWYGLYLNLQIAWNISVLFGRIPLLKWPFCRRHGEQFPTHIGTTKCSELNKQFDLRKSTVWLKGHIYIYSLQQSEDSFQIFKKKRHIKSESRDCGNPNMPGSFLETIYPLVNPTWLVWIPTKLTTHGIEWYMFQPGWTSNFHPNKNPPQNFEVCKKGLKNPAVLWKNAVSRRAVSVFWIGLNQSSAPQNKFL